MKSNNLSFPTSDKGKNSDATADLFSCMEIASLRFQIAVNMNINIAYLQMTDIPIFYCYVEFI